MVSLFSRIGIAILSFITGVALAFLCMSTRHLQPASIRNTLRPSTKETTPRPSGGLSPNPDDYYLPDWKPYLNCNEFSSARSADKALDEELSFDGYRIINRTSKLNAKRHRVGRRIVAIYCCGKEGQQAAHVLWTNGTQFCDLIAPSIQSALDFERANNL